MLVAHLRGLLKPVGRQADDRMREDTILEALHMEENAQALSAMCVLTATMYGGAPLKADSRKKIFGELLDKAGDARMLSALDINAYRSRTSELAPEQVYAAMVAAGVLTKKQDG